MREELEVAFHYSPSALPVGLHDEFALIGAVIIQLEQKSPETQRRIMAYLNALYG